MYWKLNCALILVASATSSRAEPDADITIARSIYQLAWTNSDDSSFIRNGLRDLIADAGPIGLSVRDPDPISGEHVMEAEIDAVLNGFTLSGTGSARYETPRPDDPTNPGRVRTRATASADMTLLVSSPVDIEYSYSGVATSQGTAGVQLLSGFSFAIFDVNAGGDPLFLERTDFTQAMTTFESSGSSVSLDPGLYRISFSSGVSGGNRLGFDSEQVDFQFSATIVPAPATTALIGVGGLIASRRRR